MWVSGLARRDNVTPIGIPEIRGGRGEPALRGSGVAFQLPIPEPRPIASDVEIANNTKEPIHHARLIQGADKSTKVGGGVSGEEWLHAPTLREWPKEAQDGVLKPS